MGDKRRETGDGIQERLQSGDWETGDERKEMGDRRKDMGDRRNEMGDRRWET